VVRKDRAVRDFRLEWASAAARQRHRTAATRLVAGDVSGLIHVVTVVDKVHQAFVRHSSDSFVRPQILRECPNLEIEVLPDGT